MAETKTTVSDRELLAEEAAGRQLMLIALAGPVGWTPLTTDEAETDRWGGVLRSRVERS